MSAATASYQSEIPYTQTVEPTDDDLRPVKGIMTAVVLGVPLWAGLIWIARALIA